MAQWVNALAAAKPADWNSVPETHVFEGENQLPQFGLRPPHKYLDTEVKYVSIVMKGNEVMGVLTAEYSCSPKLLLGSNTQCPSIKNENR